MKLLTALVLLAATVALRAEPEYPQMGPDIYDVQADGTAQIAAAVAQARAEHKHVLVKLGANWCIWCRRLSHTFETDAAVAAALHENYVLVLVDVNHRQGKARNDAVNDRYGNPMAQGLPVLVVLDENGRQLTTQETGALEDGKSAHDPAKVTAFLRQWAPKR
ncbi:thioredoxin family protein [Opitutus sp. GAS368]|jgi:thiol:disulfide interchange protein|uniref:thioredoxin family protein n=1 Tax=Opitutus sp. GAS368 TaxID=1882749 RepID=UPI00087C5760|nr:thioredoxin family protein [Opitutus sp. GAS368]SDR70256.1 Thioredoxin-like [Opitutus sp. GAS368]